MTASRSTYGLSSPAGEDWRYRSACVGEDPEPTTLRRRRGLDLTGTADEHFADRFWSKVDPTGECWEWTAYRNNHGYGQFTVTKGVFYAAHNVSYALTHGPIPAGLSTCHRCDNPPCVNPDHLFLGTQSDNARDMFAKGRAIRSHGVARANARLTDVAVRDIRTAAAYRGLIKNLAERYGVSTTTIRGIRMGKKWRHVA
jgi:hypothetical protein